MGADDMEQLASARPIHERSVPILMYHSISGRASSSFADFAVPPDRFTEQVKAVREAGFRAVTISELAGMRRSGRWPTQPLVALTFDDGYRDFLSEALPVMRSAGMTATLYVTTGYVGGTSRWLASEGEANRAMLGWSELAEVAGEGVEIGAHSATHPQMDLLSPSALRREAATPRLELEDRLSVAVQSFAYPYGYARRETRQAVRALGYDNACGVADLTSTEADDLFALPRLTVTSTLDGETLVSLLEQGNRNRARVQSAVRSRFSYALRRAGVKKRESAAYSRGLT